MTEEEYKAEVKRTKDELAKLSSVPATPYMTALKNQLQRRLTDLEEFGKLRNFK